MFRLQYFRGFQPVITHLGQPFPEEEYKALIVTIMLNYIAIGLSAFLLAEVFRDNENGGLVAQTKIMPDSARIPALNPIFEFDWSAGRDEVGAFEGTLVPTGIRPAFSKQLSDRDVTFDPSLFDSASR